MAKPPFAVEYHQDPNCKFHFAPDVPDDVWLSAVGADGWIVLSHDRKFHTILPECSAIKQHKIGCFYLWGASERPWNKLRCFMSASNGIIRRAEVQGRPFIYDVLGNGQINQVAIP